MDPESKRINDPGVLCSKGKAMKTNKYISLQKKNKTSNPFVVSLGGNPIKNRAYRMLNVSEIHYGFIIIISIMV